MEFEIKAGVFAQTVALMNSLTEECWMDKPKSTGGSIQLTGIEPAHVAMVTARIPIKKLDYRKYDTAIQFRQEVLESRARNLYLRIMRQNPNEPMILVAIPSLDPSRPGLFRASLLDDKYRFHPLNYGTTDTGYRSKPTIPKMDPHIIQRVNIKDFHEGIVQLNKSSEHISLVLMENNEFHISGGGNPGNPLGDESIRLAGNSERLTDIPEAQGTVRSLYSGDYLKTIAEPIHRHMTTETATLLFRREYPLTILARDDKTGTKVKYLMAPRIEE